jgi:hypothetical protein
MLIRHSSPAFAGQAHMDKGNAMNGSAIAFKTGLALVLVSGLFAGCATNRTERVVETIPAQVCGGHADSDGDGVSECEDRCPGTLRGERVGPDGCPEPVLVPKPYRG